MNTQVKINGTLVNQCESICYYSIENSGSILYLIVQNDTLQNIEIDDIINANETFKNFRSSLILDRALKTIDSQSEYILDDKDRNVIINAIIDIPYIFHTDHWVTISDRFDLQIGIDEGTNEKLLILYPVDNIDGQLQTDTSNWLDIYRSGTNERLN